MAPIRNLELLKLFDLAHSETEVSFGIGHTVIEVSGILLILWLEIGTLTETATTVYPIQKDFILGISEIFGISEIEKPIRVQNSCVIQLITWKKKVQSNSCHRAYQDKRQIWERSSHGLKVQIRNYAKLKLVLNLRYLYRTKKAFNFSLWNF